MARRPVLKSQKPRKYGGGARSSRYPRDLRSDGAGLNGPVTVTPPSKPVDSQRFGTPTMRQRVLVRDGGKCAYCGAHVDNDTANLDHVLPWKLGGRTNEANLVLACRECNKAKGNATSPDPRALRARGKRYSQPWQHRGDPAGRNPHDNPATIGRGNTGTLRNPG